MSLALVGLRIPDEVAVFEILSRPGRRLATVADGKSQPRFRAAQTCVELEHTSGNLEGVSGQWRRFDVSTIIGRSCVNDQITAVAFRELNPSSDRSLWRSGCF